MEYHKIVGTLCLLLLVSGSFASAITGSIGNARMILRPEQGETIDRTILVRNTNDVSVEINLSASGDLADDIIIHDDVFLLQPGEEKKAAFSVTATKQGSVEGNINVLFKPTDGSNGVGLTSTIVVITEGGGFFDFGDDDSADDEDALEDLENEDPVDEDNGNAGASSPLFIATLVIVLLFLILVAVYMYIRMNEDGDAAYKHTKKEKTKPKKAVKKK